MYILTNNEHKIIYISETIGYQENGNALVDNGTLAIATPLFDHVYENVEVPEKVAAEMWCYDGEQFYRNEANWPSLADYKKDAIANSKTSLARWLENNPLLYSDGKYYSATEEKQSLLTSNLTAYSLAVQLGVENPELTWNATGEECVEWGFADLAQLALAIKAYVKTRVSAQQAYEVEVNACGSYDEVDALYYDYENA